MFRCAVFLAVCAGLVLAANLQKKHAKHPPQKRQRGGCTETQFLCKNGLCIQDEWTCDTDNDCFDNSDEVNCPANCTSSHSFECGNGRCITIEYRCDGDNDCGDSTDEGDCANFECTANEWKCANDLCIESAYQCDSDNDCGDNSDEASCPQ